MYNRGGSVGLRQPVTIGRRASIQMRSALLVLKLVTKAAKTGLHIRPVKLNNPVECAVRCWRRLLSAHYRTHGAHKHVVVGHSMELLGGLASLLRAEMVAASLLTMGAMVILSVALFAEERLHDD